MITIHETFRSETDEVVKYILSSDIFPEFGKNEVSVIWKENKTVICMPSQTNCYRGCVFCHLTGTTRPVENLPAAWFIEVIVHLIDVLHLDDDNLLISFMGAGEPLCNYEEIIKCCCSIEHLSGIRYAIATTMPDIGSFADFTEKVVQYNIDMKVHLSLHGIETRKDIMKNDVDAYTSVTLLDWYTNSNQAGPVEIHYTLIDGVNDSEEEMKLLKACTFISAIKFISFNPVNSLMASEKYSKQDLIDFFGEDNVEFYTPPGIDIGASCGQFNREIYNDNNC